MNNKTSAVTAKRRFLSRLLFALSLFFLAFGLVSLGWAMWPTSQSALVLTIPSGVLPGAPAGTVYASPFESILTVTWPRRVRLGQTGPLWVDVTPSDPTVSEAVKEDLQVILVEPVLPGIKLDPPGLVQGNLSADQPLSFAWTLEPLEKGTFFGKVYISFGFYEEATDEMKAVPVAVVDFDVQAVSLWGLEANLVLWLGVIGLVFWGACFIIGRFLQTAA